MNRKNCGGFTLMELLVVIGVITIILGIVFTATNMARHQSWSNKCLSNMKQLTTSWLRYFDDNDFRIVSAYTSRTSDWVNNGDPNDPNRLGNTKQAIESGALYQYTLMDELYKCPADRSEQLRSYSISYNMNGEKKGAEKSFPNLRTPSKHMVFIDELDWLNNVGWNVDSWVLENNGEYWGDPIVEWHNKGTNVSFADTHAEHRAWKIIDTITYAKRHIKPPDPTLENEDLEFLQQITGGVK